MEPTGTKNTITNATKINIVLVHGLWGDASSWSKVIPFLQDAGHRVIAVELPLHSLADDVAIIVIRTRIDETWHNANRWSYRDCTNRTVAYVCDMVFVLHILMRPHWPGEGALE
jgi:pimeloyl-ACP methyl ester carboxylesterase